jgi:DedD protein
MEKNDSASQDAPCKDEQLVQLPRKRAMGWVVIFCFTSAWIFLLGILVGRGMAPVKFDMDNLQKELTALKIALIKKEQQLTTKDTNILAEKPDFEFHENLKKPKPDTTVIFQDVATEPIEPSQKIIPSHKTQNVTKKKQFLEKSEKPPLDKPIELPVETDSAEKQFTLQISSLKDPKVADQMVTSLQKQGFPAYQTTVTLSKNNIWYRVRAGHFSSKEESQAMMIKLKKEYKDVILIKN